MAPLAKVWRFLASHRMRIAVLLVVLSLIAPHPTAGQFGFLFGLANIVAGGLNTLNNVMTAINDTLRKVIGPILEEIHSTILAAREIAGLLFDYQRDIVYPQEAIDRARAVIAQVRGVYDAVRAGWNVPARSATLPGPRQLEDTILSRDPSRIGVVDASFEAVYAALPPATEAHPAQRDLIDGADAAAKAAMKRSIAIDAIADQELAAADRMMDALESAAPGTAEMIGAQAGAWLIRSHAYTQQALAELMRVRSIELAVESARIKEAARYARETRKQLSDLNR